MITNIYKQHTNAVTVGLLLAIPLAFLMTIPTASAQQGLAVKIQPSTIEERLDPGEKIEGVLTITNQNGGQQTYYLGTQNIESMNESGRPIFADDAGSDPYRAAAWIVPHIESVMLEVGQHAEVPYTITVPEDASPGSYFAAIFVTREADKATESGAGVGFQVASLVNLRVTGDVVEGILVREFSTDRTFYKESAVEFTVRLENTGTVHERPRGIITIVDMLGNEIDQLVVNEQGGGVLPRTDRVFTTNWTTDAFSFGRYTALASIVFGEVQRETVTREVTYWIVPLKEMGVALGIIAFALLLILLSLRAYVRRALRKAGTASVQKEQKNISFVRRLVRTTAWLIAILALLFIGMIVFFS